MKVVYEIGKKFPKSCDKCKLFVNHFGIPSYCVAGGEYTEKEIEEEECGGEQIYYHGCLTNRPKNCPLKEANNE